MFSNDESSFWIMSFWVGSGGSGKSISFKKEKCLLYHCVSGLKVSSK
jgi:hypothetical protein